MGRPPSEIRARLEARSGRYQVGYLEHPGHWYNSPETDRARAIAWARRNRDRLLGDPGKRVALRELVRGFFAPDGQWRRRMSEKGQTMSEQHLSNLSAMLERYVVPLFGERDPRELTGRAIDDEILGAKALSGRALAPATKYKICHAFSVLLQDLLVLLLAELKLRYILQKILIS